MKTKLVYKYNDEGYFLNNILLNESDISPNMEWNIPANCTEISPFFKDGFKCKWNGKEWMNIEIPHDVMCYFDNGLNYKIVKSDYTIATGEVIFESSPTVEELEKSFSGYSNAILNQAKELKLNELKSLFSTVSYLTEKKVDGALTDEQYDPIRKLKASWRTAYNAIQVAMTLEEVNAITYSTEIPSVE